MSDKKIKKIYLNQENKIIGGVCGGLAEYFELDPIIIRLIFVFLTIFGGSGILIYLILWIFLPKPEEDKNKEIKEKIIVEKKDIQKNNKRQIFFAWLLIIIGVALLFNNLAIPNFLGLVIFWPIIIVFLGLYLILKE